MISIIIPVYNGEKYLERCLMSCVQQTYQDIEIIVVDDASTDGTRNIILSYCEKYPDKVKGLFQTENHKQGAARNAGIKEAKGEFIVFVDSDDYVAKNMCEIYMAVQRASDCDIVISDVWVTSENDCRVSTMLPNADLNGLDTVIADYFIDCACWAKMYRKSLILNTGIFFPEDIFFEDSATVPLWLMASNKTVKIKDALYYYVQIADSTCHGGEIDRDMDAIKSLDIFQKHVKEEHKEMAYQLQLSLFSVMRVMDTVGRLRMKHGGGNRECFERMQNTLIQYAGDYKDNPYIKICYSQSQKDLIDILAKGTFEEYIAYEMKSDGLDYLNENTERIQKIITALIDNLHRNIIVWGMGRYGQILYDIVKQLNICEVYPVDMSDHMPSYVMQYSDVKDEDAIILTMNAGVYDYARKIADERIIVNILDCLRYGIC